MTDCHRRPATSHAAISLFKAWRPRKGKPRAIDNDRLCSRFRNSGNADVRPRDGIGRKNRARDFLIRNGGVSRDRLDRLQHLKRFEQLERFEPVRPLVQSALDRGCKCNRFGEKNKSIHRHDLKSLLGAETHPHMRRSSRNSEAGSTLVTSR